MVGLQYRGEHVDLGAEVLADPSNYEPRHRAEITEEDMIIESAWYLKQALEPIPASTCTGGLDYSNMQRPSKYVIQRVAETISKTYGAEIITAAIYRYHSLG